MKITFIELDLWYSMITYPSVLTLILDFFLLSEVVIMQQIDNIVHKLKPRLFYNSKSILQTFIPSVDHA